jgi:hypothetical protein
MDFYNEWYPKTKIHIALLKQPTNKCEVSKIMAESNNIAFANADIVCSIKHALIAVHRALWNQANFKAKVAQINNDILFCMAPGNQYDSQ